MLSHRVTAAGRRYCRNNIVVRLWFFLIWMGATFGEREKQLQNDPKEQAVLQIFAERAAAANENIRALPESLNTERAKLQRRLDELKASADAPEHQIQLAERALREFPKTPEMARVIWGKDAANAARAASPMSHAEVFLGKDENARDISRRNFLALMFCLMLGTAARPPASE